jgi:phage terminase large subunit-like protein
MACKKERVFENTHIVADVKSKKILSIKVIDEHVHDSKALPELVNNFMKIDSRTITVGKLFADGASDRNDIFRCISDNRILPCISVRKNARFKFKTGHMLRNLSVWRKEMN